MSYIPYREICYICRYNKDSCYTYDINTIEDIVTNLHKGPYSIFTYQRQELSSILLESYNTLKDTNIDLANRFYELSMKLNYMDFKTLMYDYEYKIQKSFTTIDVVIHPREAYLKKDIESMFIIYNSEYATLYYNDVRKTVIGTYGDKHRIFIDIRQNKFYYIKDEKAIELYKKFHANPLKYFKLYAYEDIEYTNFYEIDKDITNYIKENIIDYMLKFISYANGV